MAELIGVDSPSAIDKQAVRRLKLRLADFETSRGGTLSIRGRNYRLTILRAFLRYLIQEEELDVLPPDRITLLKEPERKVNVLRSDQMAAILSVPDGNDRNGRRGRVILELLFSTGLRISELHALNRMDVNLVTREIAVRGKGGKIRVAFVSPQAAEAVKSYLESRLDHLAPLLIRHPHKASVALPPGDEFRLSKVSIYKFVKRCAARAGIVGNVSPHTLRHTFASDLLRGGADLRSIQEMLGHESLSTTQKYTHVTNPELKRVHDACHRQELRRSGEGKEGPANEG